MTKRNITLLSIFTLLLTVFAACSSDDDDSNNKYPLSLTYKESKTSDFKLFVGSDTGGTDVSIDELNIVKLLDKHGYSTIPITEYAKSIIITFTSDKDMIIKYSDSISGPMTYRFENGKLYVKENNASERYFGDGNLNHLITYHSELLFTTINETPVQHQVFDINEKLSIDNVFEQLKSIESFEINSLAEMKSVTDTIAWYNRYSVYAK